MHAPGQGLGGVLPAADVGKDQERMPVKGPVAPEFVIEAGGQRQDPVLVPLAVADEELVLLSLDVVDREGQALAQAQAADVDEFERGPIAAQTDAGQERVDLLAGESLSENSEVSCYRGNGPMARREEGASIPTTTTASQEPDPSTGCRPTRSCPSKWSSKTSPPQPQPSRKCSSYLAVTYRRPKVEPSDIQYRITRSGTLSPWINASNVTSIGATAEYESYVEITVRSNQPHASASVDYLRLEIRSR
jgi:hypothetical protein